jgi:amino acid permease
LVYIYSFFKESQELRKFFNSIYWSFFVKSYYSFILISVPVILIIFYDSESIIKVHMYNFFLFSFINLIIIFIFVVIFYSIYDLPLKKIIKYCLKKDEIIAEENEEEEEEEQEENEEEEDCILEPEEEDETKSFKN